MESEQESLAKLKAFDKWLRKDKKERTYTYLFCEPIAIPDIYKVEYKKCNIGWVLSVKFLSTLFRHMRWPNDMFWAHAYFKTEKSCLKQYNKLMEKTKEELEWEKQ